MPVIGEVVTFRKAGIQAVPAVDEARQPGDTSDERALPRRPKREL
jgi:hypothetical protein